VRAPVHGPRLTRPALSYGAFVLAVTLAAAGLGLGLPHLGKEGLTVGTVVGLALLVAGSLGSLWAARRLLAGVRRRWWVAWLPVLLVTSYVAVWSVGQGVAAGWPAHPALGDRTPAAVGLAYDDVTLRTDDGVDLAAWWVPSRNGAAVALLHGAGSTRTAVLDQAEVLAGAGYGVLLVDARGHGASDGQGMDFGWYGERDAAAAVTFLARNVPDTRIGLVGLSMGGESAIGAAGWDSRVHAVVAEGATNRVAADKAYLDAYGFRGRVQQGIDRITYAMAGLVTAAPEPLTLRASVGSTSAPVLLVTAGDVPDERLAALRLRSAAPDRVEVWTVPGAGHTRGLATEPDEWRERVVDFLDDALRPPPDA
jgi:alpha-beta hydrolase superfamily lysophospholipase